MWQSEASIVVRLVVQSVCAFARVCVYAYVCVCVFVYACVCVAHACLCAYAHVGFTNLT